MIPYTPRDLLAGFDAFLAARGLRWEAVIVGGTALNLLGIIERPTRDCDVLSPPLEPPVARAARDFAAGLRLRGLPLADDWLNDGPSGLAGDLPPGWEDRLQSVYEGAVIRLRTLGRADLLRSKLFALCDRGTDITDCIALRPTRAEVEEALPWLEARDLHPRWPEHVRATMQDLRRRLGHGIP